MVISRAVASGQSWAWITSALNEHTVEKAIVLAGSLKRVKTSGKLVVITSSQVPEKARASLYSHFDLVCMMDTSMTTNNGFVPASEDHAKVFAFSLSLFQGCVYVSPNSLVLRKCDEIITSCSHPNFFLALPQNRINEPTAGSTSMFTFVPSVAHFHSLRKILKAVSKSTHSMPKDPTEVFTECIVEYAENNMLKLDLVDKHLYHQLKVTEGNLFDGTVKDLAILNFGCVDPRGAYTQSTASHMGLIESYAIDRWWNIYHSEVYLKGTSSVNGCEIASNSQKAENDPIAIIGISCRLPGANNLDEFWSLLIEGREGVSQLPAHRWQKCHTITPANSKCRQTTGGFLDLPIDKFDSKFFNISPKEAVFLDPQQRLLHEISWEALEDAAIDPLSLKGDHVGVFVGSWIHDYKDIAVKTADKEFFRVYMGNSLSSTAARLSFFYGITGPSIASESGCSSSILSVDLACKSLRNGETNLALAAGVNLFLHPFDPKSISSVLAPDGRCKTFDAKANGFGRAEGVGVLILKRMSDAIADGDRIYALIRGSAISQEGVSKSLGTPTVHCESLAMELALKDANVEARDVSFVEAHGTGTSVGDPMEVAAITKVYSEKRTDPLIIGTVKTNLGHTEAASGITGIIKVILQLQNETIVPNLNFSELNAEINLDAIPAQLPLCPMEWKRSAGTPRLAGVSSFGISGTDGHVIIQEAPDDKCPAITSIDLKLERPYHVMKITAKTSEALDQLLAAYGDLFEEQLGNETNPQLLSDLAYTANVGRATFNHRAIIMAKDVGEAANILKIGSFKQKEIHGGVEAKICFLFTGQGSQYKNMARELYLTSPVFRLAFDKCDHLLETRHNLRIWPVMWLSKDKVNVSIEDECPALDRTLYSQVAIFVVEYCLLRLWESWGIRPQFALGHSLGEYAAAICCDILTLESALELVVHRSKLIDALPKGKMLVLKLDKHETRNLLKDFYKQTHMESSSTLEFAALNSADQTVLAGDSDAIENFSKFCSEKQVKCIVLAATHAFHTFHMEPILENYREIVERVVRQEKLDKWKKKSTSCKFISGMEGTIITDQEDVLTGKYWVRHTREKVNFLEASKVAFQEGCNVFLEVGPSPILSSFILRNITEESNGGSDIVCLPSLRKNHNEWTTMLDSLSKLFLSDLTNINIDWKGFDQYYMRSKASLPFYPFQRKKVWVDFRSTPAPVHPLVGHAVPNASKSTIFENDISLKHCGYLNDHVIGNTIIYPGAAFLEMCVVAGHCAVQGFFDEFYRPRRAIILKGLRIEAPLALQDGKASRLQTVVDLNENDRDGDGMGYGIKIYNWFQDSINTTDDCEESSSNNGQWKRHASACFLPLVAEESKPSVTHVNIAEIQEKWEKHSASQDMYEKLPEVGLRFGSTFQSLVCGWKGEKAEEEGDLEGILFEVKVPADDHDAYIVHPVILDAMLQASMLWTNKDKIHKKLHVPVHIREFTWLSDGDGDSSVRYVFCSTGKGDNDLLETKTFLLDGSGLVLAAMNGIEFIETTMKLVESVVHQQSSAMPQIWEEIWKPKKGPMYRRAEPVIGVTLSKKRMIGDEVVRICGKLNQLNDQELMVYRHMDGLTLNYFLNALYKLGWEPTLGEEIVLRDFMERFGVVEGAWHYARYFFSEMVADGIVEILVNEKDRFVIKVIKLPQSKEVVERLCLETVVEAEANRGDYRLMSEMGKGLKDCLIGEVSPLNILYPEDLSKPNMGNFLDEIRPWISKSAMVINDVINSYRNHFDTNDTTDSVVCRVLEVGSGTGTATHDCLESFEKNQVQNYEYTFTDLSAAFFNKAEVKFEKYKKHMIFKKLNIEEDPLVQGFTPEYYDMIIACEVIHATKDVRETLRNLRILLKTGGHIQINETIKPDRRITMLVGMLEGYWRMTDMDLRPYHATLPKDKWVDVLMSTGYTMASGIGCYQDVHGVIFGFAADEYSIETGSKSVFDLVRSEAPKHSWLIFCDGSKISKEIQRRLKCLNRSVIVIEKRAQYYQNDNFGKQEIIKLLAKLEGDTFEGVIYLWAMNPNFEDEQDQISLPFLHLCQGFLELHKATARVYVVTRGAFLDQDDRACPNPGAATIWGIAKTLRNEQPEISVHCIDLSPEQHESELINDLFYELFWTQNVEQLIALRDGKRLVPRLASLKIADDSLNLPTFCDRCQLLLPSTKAIADLEFGPLNNYALNDDEIEVQIKCCALNFRDIFAVLKPTSQFDKINSIGSDFAGVVTKVGCGVTKWNIGDAVFGMNTEQQALPSHLKTKEHMVIGMPDHFTFAEAATIPAVFATALYCLVKVAHIKKGDVCLIHTASGGVGLSAVQIAKQFGAEIIATAGSRRKRAYLKSLGIQHVFHSRNTEYDDQILEVTKGRGVDIVLNSLTGPGFVEASIKACAKGARFVEMSKLNIWTEEQVHEVRQDVQYTVADLTSLEEQEWKVLMNEMMDCMEQDFVRPIPYTRFDAVNIRQALSYLQKAKHIGKVVCVMPELKGTVKQVQHSKSPKTMLFNERSTYLVTGGLGGIGLEVAKFMMTSGAKCLILGSRSAPKPEVEAMIKTWNENGKRVEAWKVDVGDLEQTREALERIQRGNGWPPLRGIMHAAGVLSDGTLPNQSWEKFLTTYNPKVKGTMNLHTLTKDLPHQLEHFVLFSSVSSLFGSPGQSNHSASNAFEDAFAQYRHSIGLPATSINFGIWGEVGVATEVDFPGIRPIATNQGLRSVEAILKSNRLQTAVMNVDSFGMVAKLLPKVKGYLDDQRLFGDVKTTVLIFNTDQFWAEVDRSEGRESKIDVFKRYVKNMLKSTLKMDPDEEIDDHADFQGLGVDSLMLLEMKNYLQNLFGSRLLLTAAHLKDCNTTATLASRLVDILDNHTRENDEEGESSTTEKGENGANNAFQNGSLDQPIIVG